MKWIKVSDSMPLSDHFCIFYDDKAKSIWIGYLRYPDLQWMNAWNDFYWDEKEERYCDGAEVEIEDDWEPTHWIYLPNPPVKKKEEDKEDEEENKSEVQNSLYSKKELISMIKDALANDPNYVRHVKEKHGEFTF